MLAKEIGDLYAHNDSTFQLEYSGKHDEDRQINVDSQKLQGDRRA